MGARGSVDKKYKCGGTRKGRNIKNTMLPSASMNWFRFKGYFSALSHVMTGHPQPCSSTYRIK